MKRQSRAPFLVGKGKANEGEDSRMPREIVKDFRRNNTLLFSAGSFGWVTQEESGFCLSAQGEAATREEVIVLRLGEPLSRE